MPDVTILFLGAVLATGCSSTPVSSPADFPSLPAFAALEGVQAVATFYTNHEDIFGENLIEEEGIVPVGLRIGRGTGDDAEYAAVGDQASMELRLYLADGTNLIARDYAEVTDDEDVNARVIEEALRLTFLDAWEDSEEGFVFFELAPPEDFEALGETRLLHRSQPLARELALTDSLLTFMVRTPEGTSRVSLGLLEDRDSEVDS